MPIYHDPADLLLAADAASPAIAAAVIPPVVRFGRGPAHRKSSRLATGRLVHEDEATLVLSDVYAGLEGVPRGTIKYLRILEQVPRPWAARRFWPNDSALGQHAVISLNSHIHVKIHHGVVPVDDGRLGLTSPCRPRRTCSSRRSTRISWKSSGCGTS